VNGTSFDNYRENNGRGYGRGRNQGDVLKIFQERIPHLTIKSGITMKQNNMAMEEVYRINPQKPMKKNVIGLV
jgi:hypothetical protein